MTDRTITLTPTEAEKFKALAVGESMWIVREGADCTLGDHCYAAHDDNAQHPPVEFVQACAPCETCSGHRRVAVWDSTPRKNGRKISEPWLDPCPTCRIELVGPCPNCPTVGKCAVCGSESIFTNGTVTLGYAYAVGGPVLRADDGQYAIEVRRG